MFDIVDGRRTLNVAELEMTSRHHQLISQLAKANEHIQRASVVTIETQLAANKESHMFLFALEYFLANVLITTVIGLCIRPLVSLMQVPSVNVSLSVGPWLYSN